MFRKKGQIAYLLGYLPLVGLNTLIMYMGTPVLSKSTLTNPVIYIDGDR